MQIRQINEFGHLHVNVDPKLMRSNAGFSFAHLFLFQQNLAPLGRDTRRPPKKAADALHGKQLTV